MIFYNMIWIADDPDDAAKNAGMPVYSECLNGGR